MTDNTDILSIRNVFKVFGEDPDTAMKMLDNGATKDEIFEKTGQTVGVFDASFSVKKAKSSSSWASPAPVNPPWFVS